MNSRNENEESENCNFFDNSEDWLNEKENLFSSKRSVDIPNHKNDKNDF